ncbi:hypothetical protein [Streptomyces pristinaespiralis]
MPERIWHPISKLEFFIDQTRRWVVELHQMEAALSACGIEPEDRSR